MELQERLNALKDRLLDRAPKDGVGCFLCGWILEDLHKNGRLTNHHPEKSIDGSVPFPVPGKGAHLKIEDLWHPELKPIAEEPVKG